MSERSLKPYRRKVTPLERFLRRSPYSIVTMVARIRGDVSEAMLRDAVAKVQQRHVNLRVRIWEDQDHVPWFTSDGVGEIPVEVISRASDDHWIELHREAAKVPFEFDVRPAVRFILAQSPGMSDVIILCHHILCDGLSLAYLARDLMAHLGDPSQAVEALPDPVVVDQYTMPEEVALNPIVRLIINRMNGQWERDRIVFDEEDYRAINEAYWTTYEHRILSIELTEAETTALVDRCRKEGITVNSALTAAFVGAQCIVEGERPYHSSLAVAANLRDRLRRPVGEAMGFYAGMVTLKHRFDERLGFWENARRLHTKVQPLLTNKRLFGGFLTWCHLDSAVLEAVHFKKLGRLVAPDHARHEKLSAFGRRDDVVRSILRREGQDSLDRVFLGTAVTNLTRMNFPRQYGTLELDRLIMQPGGGFPLATVNLVLGAVTCSGKLSLVVEYAEGAKEARPSMREVRDTAMEWLLRE
ncbi:MAG: hypothetical protein GX605_06925 [Chloroflexi bacterium]|nr:hypothetical protein [Chloroflexota bacterium]